MPTATALKHGEEKQLQHSAARQSLLYSMARRWSAAWRTVAVGGLLLVVSTCKHPLRHVVVRDRVLTRFSLLDLPLRCSIAKSRSPRRRAAQQLHRQLSLYVVAIHGSAAAALNWQSRRFPHRTAQSEPHACQSKPARVYELHP